MVHGKEKFPWPLTSTVSEHRGGTNLLIQSQPLLTQGNLL